VSEQRTVQGITTADDPRGSALEQHAAELFAFLAKRLRSRQEAEDLLQSIYLRFLQTPHTDLIRQPRAYLYRIAANMLSEFHLRRQRDPIVYDSNAVLDSTERAQPADVWRDVFGDRLALEDQVSRVITRLPATYRAVLLMRILNGASFREIGAKFGITEQSARKYLVRAMALCRNADWSR
jgi:RNA polymerase sigma-19 factor, ECF subfamily